MSKPLTFMRYLFLFSYFLLAINYLAAQTTITPEVIELESQKNIQLEGDIADGMLLPLDWAASSQIACFPATRFNEYQGKHQFYRVQMPANSAMEITITPKNKKHRINIYALRLGVNNDATPPNLSRAISCEAAYPIYAGKPNYRTPAKAKSVDFISLKRPYTILIGVAGAKDVLEGEFELKIAIKGR